MCFPGCIPCLLTDCLRCSCRCSCFLQLHRGSARRRNAAYIPVVHCGSIRQAAQVVGMRELALALPSTSSGSGSGSGSSAGGDAEERGEYEEEDCFSSLLGCDLMTEPSGGSIPSSATAAAAARTAGCSSGALQPDLCRLAGAVAAAGVLLPQPPLSSAGAASGSSGSASSGEGGAGWGATAPAAAPQPGSPRGQLAAALERQRSLLACDDIGCLAAVTFAFQHQPGKPSCPAAWR